MKLNLSRLMPLIVILAMGLALIPMVSVHAQAVVSVSPNNIVNNVATIITVSGTGFDATARILLDGVELPGTVFVDATSLQVTVPAGVAVGSHIITISQAGASGSAALNVSAPLPPPPTATTAPLPFARPQFVVRVSKAVGKVQTGKEFNLKVVVENMGQSTAYNAQAAFTATDLVPTKTGGIAALGTVDYDNEVDASQTFYVAAELVGKTILTVDMTMTYYDDKGTTYSDKFTLSIPVTAGAASGGVVYPTATPTSVKSSQLVISSYAANVDPLQPGGQFALKMTVQNMGNEKAQRITMIVGGGSSGTSGGTPQPGGVSGGGGDFANFAPVGASNVQSLGDLGAGDKTQASQNLIVNVS
ncbi:MAG: IPT/TIG domain-containing protein, partial [Chloroflexota bacterium]